MIGEQGQEIGAVAPTGEWTAARVRGFFEHGDDKDPWTHLAFAFNAAIAAEREKVQLLMDALKMLHDDIADYARINNLGGFDNHAMKMARTALAECKDNENH